MPLVKGQPSLNPLGRPKGLVNQLTYETRDFFKCFLEHNKDDVQALWEQAKKKDPLRAFEILLKVANICLPPIKQGDNNSNYTLQIINFQKDATRLEQVPQPQQQIKGSN